MFIFLPPLLGRRPSSLFLRLPRPPHSASIPVVIYEALPLPEVVSFVCLVVVLHQKGRSLRIIRSTLPWIVAYSSSTMALQLNGSTHTVIKGLN